MPIPAPEQAGWLEQLNQDPLATAKAVAGVVDADLVGLGPDEQVRVGTRILDDNAGRSFITSLLTSVDHVEVSALAKQYIQLAVIEPAGGPPAGVVVD